MLRDRSRPVWTRRSALAGAAALATAPARAARPDREQAVIDAGDRAAAALEAARAEGRDTFAPALALAYGATVDPRAAYARAVGEAARLQARADHLLRGQGLDRGDVAERLRHLSDDPRWLYPDTDAGRDLAVNEMNARLARLRPRLVRAFGDLSVPDAVIRRPEPAQETRGGYREPPAYYVDLRAIRERPAWTLASVAFHETVPGHALQAAQQARSPDPRRVRYAAAFSEAWAVYAERLAADLGAYADDPRGEIGALQWRLFRMARIVADIGQGALGWSADRAGQAMRDLQGRSIAFVTIETDVARMRASPGVAAAQGLGALEIARLRPRHGGAWPAFHRAILSDGPWPCGALSGGVFRTDAQR